MPSQTGSTRKKGSKKRKFRQSSGTSTMWVIGVLLVAVVLIAVFVFLRNRQGETPTNTTGENNVGVITTASGLQYEDLVTGSGQAAKAGDTVSVHYTGWLTDGTEFDSSVGRGQPFEFRLGTGGVIKGWDEGVEGMLVGGKRRLTIPSELAYGNQSVGGVIPANSTLIFEVELLGIR